MSGIPQVRSARSLLRAVAVLPALASAALWSSPAFAVTAHPAAALISSSEAAMRSDPELSRYDAQAALELLKRKPDADLEVQAYLLLCDYYSERDSGVAQQQIDKANALLPQVKRQGLRASVVNYQGEVLETAGDNAKALTFYQQAVKLATEASDDEMLAKALYSRGYILGVLGEYAEGLRDLQRAQRLFEKLSMPTYALNVMNSIALLYNRLGDYQQALQLYDQSLTLQRRNRMRREEAVTLHNRARALENLQRWDAARDGYQAAYAISQELHYPRGAAYALCGLGAVANAKHEPQEALATLERAAQLQQETPDARLHAQIQLARGIALHQLQRLPESAAALEEAQAIFAQAESLNELSSTFAALATVDAELGNWRAAYEARSQAQEVSNKVLRNQLDQRFATLKVEFDMNTRDKENQMLLRENRANATALAEAERARKLQVAVIGLSILVAIMLGIMAWHQRRGKHSMRTLAMTDELTNVPNRRAVLGELNAILQRRHASGSAPCAVMIVDIDHFKTINDEFGHPVGDETLKIVAQQLLNVAVEPNLVGRMGGEEFILILLETTHDAALAAAEKFRAVIAALDLSRWLGNRAVTVSIGVTLSVPGVDTPSSMLRRADAALYTAKNAGRNCVKYQAPAASHADVSATVISAAEAVLVVAEQQAP